MHFSRAQHARGIHLPRIQDLAAQRHHGLEVTLSGLLRAAARRITFDEEKLRARRLLGRAIGQFAGQRRSRDHPLTHHFLSGLKTCLRLLDREHRDFLAGLGMLRKPQGKRILHQA